MYEGEPFVKKEYGQGLAQSEMGCSKEEMNLIHKIDNNTRELTEGLRSIESLTENINKRLLPLMEKPVAKESKTEQAPSGWLEEHLADLRLATHKVIKIIHNLDKLSRETKTDKVGQ